MLDKNTPYGVFSVNVSNPDYFFLLNVYDSETAAREKAIAYAGNDVAVTYYVLKMSAKARMNMEEV